MVIMVDFHISGSGRVLHRDQVVYRVRAAAVAAVAHGLQRATLKQRALSAMTWAASGLNFWRTKSSSHPQQHLAGHCCEIV